MEFQILQIKDSLDGMQAMSVAPIKNGKVDLSQVVIAFAGTNLSDWKDLETDARSIMNLYGIDQEQVFLKKQQQTRFYPLVD